jgi:hypothetical protein
MAQPLLKNNNDIKDALASTINSMRKIDDLLWILCKMRVVSTDIIEEYGAQLIAKEWLTDMRRR